MATPLEREYAKSGKPVARDRGDQLGGESFLVWFERQLPHLQDIVFRYVAEEESADGYHFSQAIMQIRYTYCSPGAGRTAQTLLHSTLASWEKANYVYPIKEFMYLDAKLLDPSSREKVTQAFHKRLEKHDLQDHEWHEIIELAVQLENTALLYHLARKAPQAMDFVLGRVTKDTSERFQLAIAELILGIPTADLRSRFTASLIRHDRQQAQQILAELLAENWQSWDLPDKAIQVGNFDLALLLLYQEDPKEPYFAENWKALGKAMAQDRVTKTNGRGALLLPTPAVAKSEWRPVGSESTNLPEETLAVILQKRQQSQALTEYTAYDKDCAALYYYWGVAQFPETREEGLGVLRGMKDYLLRKGRIDLLDILAVAFASLDQPNEALEVLGRLVANQPQEMLRKSGLILEELAANLPVDQLIQNFTQLSLELKHHPPLWGVLERLIYQDRLSDAVTFLIEADRILLALQQQKKVEEYLGEKGLYLRYFSDLFKNLYLKDADPKDIERLHRYAGQRDSILPVYAFREAKRYAKMLEAMEIAIVQAIQTPREELRPLLPYLTELVTFPQYRSKIGQIMTRALASFEQFVGSNRNNLANRDHTVLSNLVDCLARLSANQIALDADRWVAALKRANMENDNPTYMAKLAAFSADQQFVQAAINKYQKQTVETVPGLRLEALVIIALGQRDEALLKTILSQPSLTTAEFERIVYAFRWAEEQTTPVQWRNEDTG